MWIRSSVPHIRMSFRKQSIFLFASDRKGLRWNRCSDVFFRMNIWILRMGSIMRSCTKKDTEGCSLISIIPLFPRAPADDRAKKLFEKLRTLGFRYCFVSNNQKPRVEPFAKAVEGDFIENAHKPAGKNYKKACQVIGIDLDRTIFIGDQLFTDIYGAKRAGIRTILVKPIHPKEEIQIVLKRYLEKIVLHFYQKEEGKNS